MIMNKLLIFAAAVAALEASAASPVHNRVIDYSPAPGQFVNLLPEWEEGDDAAAMAAKALQAMTIDESIISLGGWGGSVTVGFERTIVNVPGKRDIYMTKIEAGEGTFLNAENIGLPFNSPSDDFAYIVADADKLAWFASTRNQPEGKVCVYTFVPTDTRQNYEALSMGEKELHSLACLNRIRATWPTPEKRESAMQQLYQLKQENSLTHSKADGINFVINDRITYNSIDQFKSDETRMAYYETVRLRNELTSKTAKLSAMRAQYHTAADGDKAQIGLKIQQLELQTDELRQTLKRALGELRQKESKI